MKLPYRSALLILLTTSLSAQPDRVSAAPDKSHTVFLSTHLRPEANFQSDLGRMDPATPVPDLVIYLRPSAAQQTALDDLIAQLHDPRSASYHNWLQPEEYASRFGTSPADIAKIRKWLRSEGFTIGPIARGGSWISFHGNAGQVKQAFGTEIHRYRAQGELHYANSSNPSIPAAFADVVGAIDGLHDFRPRSEVIVSNLEATSSNGTHSLAPGDLATIYNVTPLHQAGIDGTGQKIVIVGESNLDLTDIQAFRARYRLPNQDVQIILADGSPDPGTNASLIEGDLDVEWSGAMAPNATIVYVYASNWFNAVRHAIDHNLAPVISASWRVGCEAFVGSSFMASGRILAQQAVVQGITWINSSGDAGPAGCDGNGSPFAQGGYAARFPASIPEVTAVGGTVFSDLAGGPYWSATNDANGASALSYIPEAPWNDSEDLKAVLASGGGASIFFPKPPWQAGPGVPDDGVRDVPDIALTASSHDPYVVVSGGKLFAVSGTSASAPAFAGMVSLLNHYLVSTGSLARAGLGNINPMLYSLAQSTPAAFHDIASGVATVPCFPGTPDCKGPTIGFSATPGYDLATGLGSVDLNRLAHAWVGTPAKISLVVPSIDRNPVFQHQPNTQGLSWNVVLRLTEEAGVAATLTDFLIDGASAASQIVNFFGSASIPAHGFIEAPLGFKNVAVPTTRTFTFRGTDANGGSWSREITVPFLGFPPTPAIGGPVNAASNQKGYAPGMILTVYGSQLSSGTQASAALPLLTFAQNFLATVNNVFAPIFYVSPGQANIQIPYGTPPGPASLRVYNGDQGALTTIQVTAAAPGIFVDSTGFSVPFASGSAGQALILFITGAGEMLPRVSTGAAPPPGTPIAGLPKPLLPVSMTIGGVDAPIVFAGTPSGLVGVTQINFSVPAGLAPGKQAVVVTVGGVQSPAASFTIK